MALAPRARFKPDTFHRREPPGQGHGHPLCLLRSLISPRSLFSSLRIPGVMGSSEAEIQAAIFKRPSKHWGGGGRYCAAVSITPHLPGLWTGVLPPALVLPFRSLPFFSRSRPYFMDRLASHSLTAQPARRQAPRGGCGLAEDDAWSPSHCRKASTGLRSREQKW